MSQPKLPTGPAPAGAAAVRALESTGNWQTRTGADYVARTKDGFSRVVVSGGGPVIAGYANDVNYSAYQTRDAYSPYRKIPQSGPVAGREIDCGGGLHFRYNLLTSNGLDPIGLNYHGWPYSRAPRPPSTNAGDPYTIDESNVVYTWVESKPVLCTGIYAWVSSGGSKFSGNFVQTYTKNMGVNWDGGPDNRILPMASQINFTTPKYVYVGRKTVNNVSLAVVMAVSMNNTGRSVVTGSGSTKILRDPTLNYFYSDGTTGTSPLPMPPGATSLTEFEQPYYAASGQGLYLLLPQYMKDLSDTPKLWFYRSQDFGATWTVTDASAVLADITGDFTVRQVYVTGALITTPPNCTLFRDAASLSLTRVSECFNSLFVWAQSSFTDRNTWLVAFPFWKRTDNTIVQSTSGVTTTIYDFNLSLGVASRVAQFTPAGVSTLYTLNPVIESVGKVSDATGVHDHLFTALTSSQWSGTAIVSVSAPEPRFAQMIHIGSGKLVAKMERLSPIGGRLEFGNYFRNTSRLATRKDNDIYFTYSANGGVTWTTIAATGLPSPMKNEYYGNINVTAAAGASTDGVLSITCWNITNNTYEIYKSTDHGVTWKYLTKIIVDPSINGFNPVDVHEEGDVWNFNRLVPTSITAPVDITVPNRYATP